VTFFTFIKQIELCCFGKKQSAISLLKQKIKEKTSSWPPSPENHEMLIFNLLIKTLLEQQTFTNSIY